MTRNQNEIVITEEESRNCKICNKSFPSSKLMIWHVRKDHNLDFEHYILKTYYDDIIPTCLKTGGKLTFKAHKRGPWFSNFSKNNFPRKPHSNESKLKIKLGCEKTSMEKFGVKNVFESEWCKEKYKDTMIKKYGVDNIMKTNEMRNLFSTFIKSNGSIDKTKQTNLQKYGYSRFTSTDENKLNLRKYNYHKFYSDWNLYNNYLYDKQIQCVGDESFIKNCIKLKFKCCVCNFEWEDTLLIPFCKNCEEKFKNARSIEESSLMKWINEFVPHKFVSNKRFNINGKVYEADICFEELKIIIELNGLYWHSEKAGKDKNYHINKLNSLESIGYTVIQIFEDEWLFKTNLVKNKILHKLKCNNTLLKIYARNCSIKKINNTECKVFLDSTHIQGHVNSSYCYGAFYKEELVSVMTLSSPRINMGNKNKKSGEYELVRFSASNKYRIIGIASKLLKHIIIDIKPIKIISYADKRWTPKTNNLYDKIGFKLVGDTQPNYWYVKKYKREYRFNFTKQKLVKMGNDPLKTEREIMKDLGYDRIWDCGHLKYEMELKNE